MRKSVSLISALVITLVFANFYFTLENDENSQLEPVLISRVIDGDTLESSEGIILRLVNINTPEKNQPNSNLSRNYLLSLNKEMMADYMGIDKYGRQLARLYSDGYINLKMVELGYSSKFLVQDDEKSLFAKAEAEAVKSGLGIWEHSDYYGCFSTEIDKKNEVVEFIVKCPVSMDGWFVKDESRKRFIFNNFTSGSYFILNSGNGINSENTLYWNSESVWNDDSDALYLFDHEWKIAHYESY